MNEAEFIIICPHCNDPIIIEKINCGIFRHGIFKLNLEQIPPHSPKELCDKYVENDEIYGCGKPFEIRQNPNQEHSQENSQEYEIIICGYI